MKKAEECKNMIEIRKEIDSLDKQIVELIAHRSTYVKHAAKFKKNETVVKDVDRVKKVIDSKVALAKQFGVSSELIERLYTVMIDFFVSEELKEWEKSNM
jgi:isochorismate pyruvate lyase